MPRLKFTIGDWSKDGHSKHDDVLFTSNHTGKEVREAYKLAVVKSGFDLCKEVAREYEDSKISVEHLNLLKEKFGFDFEKEWDDLWRSYQDENAFAIENYSDLCVMFLYMAKSELPDLEWKLEKSNTDEEVVGGYSSGLSLGYGLFHL